MPAVPAPARDPARGLREMQEPAHPPSEGILSGLKEDERIFILLYRQLDTEQRENLVRYVMDTINRELPSEADPQGSG